MDLFSKYKQPLIEEIENAFAEHRQEYASVNPWGATAADMLSQFATQGKLIRGSLVLFASEMFGGGVSKDVLRIGAALEILHSSLLIHDDIMDNDLFRRGQPSIHNQFEALVKEKEVYNSKHTGVSLAICTGDIGYFLAWELVGYTVHPEHRAISQKIAHEVSLVGIAQMQDVSAADGLVVDEKQILHTYMYKTGRYSVSLPLAIGAMLTNQDKKVIELLECFGEKVGVLFQLTDDTLSLFGKQEDTGKLNGSDIKENKKTIYRALLFSSADTEETKQLEQIFGNTDLEQKDIVVVHDLIEKYRINEEVSKLCKQYEEEAQAVILDLPITEDYKKQLNMFVGALSTRNR